MNWDKANIKTMLEAATQDPGGCYCKAIRQGPLPYRKLVFRMLQAIYERQTADERESRATKHNNGIGFNGLDGPFLSEVARSSAPHGQLTTRQCKTVAKALIKYAGQLEQIAAERMATK